MVLGEPNLFNDFRSFFLLHTWLESADCGDFCGYCFKLLSKCGCWRAFWSDLNQASLVVELRTWLRIAVREVDGSDQDSIYGLRPPQCSALGYPQDCQAGLIESVRLAADRVLSGTLKKAPSRQFPLLRNVAPYAGSLLAFRWIVAAAPLSARALPFNGVFLWFSGLILGFG